MLGCILEIECCKSRKVSFAVSVHLSLSKQFICYDSWDEQTVCSQLLECIRILLYCQFQSIKFSRKTVFIRDVSLNFCVLIILYLAEAFLQIHQTMWPDIFTWMAVCLYIPGALWILYLVLRIQYQP